MKTKKMVKQKMLLIILTITIIILSTNTFAQPTGTTLTNLSTSAGLIPSPDNRTDPGGSITILSVNALQQNPRWKAYVGNITGSLTLDDAQGRTIYQWTLSSTVTGNVFSSTSSSVTWGSIRCADTAIINSEQSELGVTGSADNITRTFNETIHPLITIGGSPPTNIDANTCPATSTFVEQIRQAQGSATYPLVLLDDTTNLVYATPINQASTGYYTGSVFDFQMIMANNVTSPTTYYFYAEIGS